VRHQRRSTLSPSPVRYGVSDHGCAWCEPWCIIDEDESGGAD
jgi:hypothetical protein